MFLVAGGNLLPLIDNPDNTQHELADVVSVNISERIKTAL